MEALKALIGPKPYDPTVIGAFWVVGTISSKP